MSNIFIGLKKTCLGVLDRGDHDKNTAIGLKEGGGIEMSTTVLHSRAALTFVFNILFGIVKMHRWISMRLRTMQWNVEIVV